MNSKPLVSPEELEVAYSAIGSVQALMLPRLLDPAVKTELDQAFTLAPGAERGRAIVAALLKGSA